MPLPKSLHCLLSSLCSPRLHSSIRLHQMRHASILRDPKKYRGLTYSYKERAELGLEGLLPPVVRTPHMEEISVIKNLDRFQTDLSKYIYLRGVMDINERLFFKLLVDYTEKLMPVVYTPTVGEACIHFSTLFRRPMGIFISPKYKGRIYEILGNWREQDVRAIVVTDGERILGLGDQGANGMGIAIGKLALYSALSGIPPHFTLPVTIDVGTNNEALLNDPLYIGVKHNRMRGDEYVEICDEFMEAVVKRFGKNCLIQFEDFGHENAFLLKDRYHNKYCTFNDDIQGTASVVVAGIYASLQITGKKLQENTFFFAGAGEAALGTSRLLVMALMREGLTLEEARDRIWLTDAGGLLVDSRDDVEEEAKGYVKNRPHLKPAELSKMVDQIKPDILIGLTGKGQLFTKEILQSMAANHERPIIFALSNPTSCAECTAEEAYQFTEGRVVFASGSPFDDVTYNGKVYAVGQGNNAYIFPAVALSVLASGLEHIDNSVFLEAARSLSKQVTKEHLDQGRIYPPLKDIHRVSMHVASHILEYFYDRNWVSKYPRPYDAVAFLRTFQYTNATAY